MAQVRIIYKIFPSEAGDEVLSSILEELRDKGREVGFEVVDHKEEPIAFGLKALLVLVVVDEREGVLDKVEEAINSIEDISSVEVMRMTRA
jgi:elongation factor 1-beta